MFCFFRRDFLCVASVVLCFSLCFRFSMDNYFPFEIDGASVFLGCVRVGFSHRICGSALVVIPCSYFVAHGGGRGRGFGPDQC